MRRGKGTFTRAAALALLLIALIPPPAFLSAASPRRVAIAPFTNLSGQDEIRGTIALLPRLLSSRLMALAGAEVVLLPAGDNATQAAAKEAGCPFLLQGAVAKVGKGYSIDVTAFETAGGSAAGSFFVSAATEDEIIPQLGGLAADIAEKLFGVKGTPRAAAPAPAPVVVPAPLSAAPAATVAAPAGAAAAAAAPPAPAAEWTPSALKEVAQSDKVPDELYGVVAGDVDAEGNGEVVAWGRSSLHIYRVKGSALTPYMRIPREVECHILNVETFDLEGDGRREILVTALQGERLASFVLKRVGDGYEEAASGIPYFFVVLPDWQGKRLLVGQSQGTDTLYYGKIVALKWDGKKMKEAEPLPARTNVKPLDQGVLGLSSARFGKEWKLVYTDEFGHLRVLAADGKTEHKSGETYGTSLNYLEWGPLIVQEGRKARYPVRAGVRVMPAPEGKPVFLIPWVEPATLNLARFYESTRLVLLQWDGSAFVERTGTGKSDLFVSGADFLAPPASGRGRRIVAARIEQEGSTFKDKASRLLLFEAE